MVKRIKEIYTKIIQKHQHQHEDLFEVLYKENNGISIICSRNISFVSSTFQTKNKHQYSTHLLKYRGILFYYEKITNKSDPSKIISSHYSIEEIQKDMYRLNDVILMIDDLQNK